jgi:hypothetical protein
MLEPDRAGSRRRCSPVPLLAGPCKAARVSSRPCSPLQRFVALEVAGSIPVAHPPIPFSPRVVALTMFPSSRFTESREAVLGPSKSRSERSCSSFGITCAYTRSVRAGSAWPSQEDSSVDAGPTTRQQVLKSRTSRSADSARRPAAGELASARLGLPDRGGEPRAAARFHRARCTESGRDPPHTGRPGSRGAGAKSRSRYWPAARTETTRSA